MLYSTFTAYLGFKVNEDEYKVMGLAGYGQPTLVEQVRKLIRRTPMARSRLIWITSNFTPLQNARIQRVSSNSLVRRIRTNQSIWILRKVSGSLIVLPASSGSWRRHLWKWPEHFIRKPVCRIYASERLALNGVANARILQNQALSACSFRLRRAMPDAQLARHFIATAFTLEIQTAIYPIILFGDLGGWI